MKNELNKNNKKKKFDNEWKNDLPPPSPSNIAGGLSKSPQSWYCSCSWTVAKEVKSQNVTSVVKPEQNAAPYEMGNSEQCVSLTKHVEHIMLVNQSSFSSTSQHYPISLEVR